MPNYLNFYRKGTKENVSHKTMDEEMCKHFDQPVDPDKYLAGWPSIIGSMLAHGASYDETIANYKKMLERIGKPRVGNREELTEEDREWIDSYILIAEYMKEHYDFSSGYMPKL